MITLNAVLGVALVAFLMVITPGPNMIYLASRSISQGRNAGLISLAGVGCGFLIYLIATAAGLTALLITFPQVFTAIKLCGALYLIYLAWNTLKPGGKSAFDTENLKAHSRPKLFSMGLVTNLLNPKIALMYMALVPQFVDTTRGPVWAQVLLLGSVQIAIAMLINGSIVLAASRISGFLKRNPKWLKVQKLAAGLILAGFAVKMVFD